MFFPACRRKKKGVPRAGDNNLWWLAGSWPVFDMYDVEFAEPRRPVWRQFLGFSGWMILHNRVMLIYMDTQKRTLRQANTAGMDLAHPTSLQTCNYVKPVEPVPVRGVKPMVPMIALLVNTATPAEGIDICKSGCPAHLLAHQTLRDSIMSTPDPDPPLPGTQGSIEIDPGFHPADDSGLSDDDAYLSSTQSLTSSINQYIFENGEPVGGEVYGD
jgi:hypothetical protein